MFISFPHAFIAEKRLRSAVVEKCKLNIVQMYMCSWDALENNKYFIPKYEALRTAWEKRTRE